MQRLVILLVGISLNMNVCLSKASKDSMVISPFGKIHLYIPDSPPESVIIMISGDGGWNWGVPNFAEHFALNKSLVIGIDIRQYYKNLISRKDRCYHVSSDFVSLATFIEKKYNFPVYQEPILMGYSSGASMVYAVLAQARPDTFRGGISVGFCPDVELPKRFCELNGLKMHAMVDGKGFDLDPDSELGNRWIVLHGKMDNECTYENTKVFMDKTADSELIELENVGHSFSKWSDFMPQWENAYHKLLNEGTSDKNSGGDLEKTEEDQSSLELPLKMTKATSKKDASPLCLFISGDGGWFSFEQHLADRMAAEGISTIGLDAKKYFWKKRTPEESAKDIAKVLNRYAGEWEKNKILLIGYSMGADVLPFIYEQLPKNLQESTVKTILLSPDTKGDFEIHLTDMAGLGNAKDNYDVVAAVQRISQFSKVDIITGSDETSAMPKALSGTSVRFESVPGDHHYNNDSKAVFDAFQK